MRPAGIAVRMIARITKPIALPISLSVQGVPLRGASGVDGSALPQWWQNVAPG